MKKLIFALIVAGLLLGPAYWTYAKFFTGSEAVVVPLRLAEAEAGKAPAWQTGPFPLTAGMAPIGLILKAQGHFSPNMDEQQPPADRYSAILSRDGVAAQPLAFTLGVKTVSNSNPAFREHLLLMREVRPGTYDLTVAPAADPDIRIDQMQLQIRQNLHEPNPDVVMAGIGMLILGIFALTLI
ncbi:hypothetical protein EZJ19_02575 [Parasulfuritortus cantonensis]|uniref:Uncharacterized protein n=1 Tax=Parasulfuritortus cantonensis TaxID=2528202 RepID=A0A4R1BL93_9PROT|nr:hypothetical protein [Parasulfuritortus cantonensis]TCJ18143.1 hypothetical protein EZJ19_02575 [Parasulfuritortus cantonensis]